MDTTRPKIMIGHRLGLLTVTASTDLRKSGYKVWECRCDCGGSILLDTRCLQRESITDCGCITKVRPKQLDLTGKRFGKLVCLEPTEQHDKSGSVLWRCKCDCGKECLAVSKKLNSGMKKSCGCLRHPPLKQFAGKQFGQLTVIDYAGKKGGMHHWRCICSCGNETIVGQTLLQTGKTKSCGCLQTTVIKKMLKLCDGTSVTTLEASKKHRLKSNTSGYTGVYLNKKNGRWVSQITFKGKTYYLGSYSNIQDAVAARKRGEEIHDSFLEWYHREHEERGEY